MQNAEGYYLSHNEKELNTVAREATQQSEDARRISIVKEREAAEQAAARRERRRPKPGCRRQGGSRETGHAFVLEADAERASAERAKHEAEIATLQARDAQKDAEAARQAAIAEQQRLANETAAAKAARVSAEQDAQALRDRLRQQLNVILETRDTARGLIVNLSDVLFDFDQASLKPGAKEKLAKVSGILLAYPTLHLNVEGHTDSVGTDEYNLKLSQRRADAVRDYLTSNGISAANVQSVGLGKEGPVASNDTATGRQQNRRVEMVVSGDVIGQPINPTTSSLR